MSWSTRYFELTFDIHWDSDDPSPHIITLPSHDWLELWNDRNATVNWCVILELFLSVDVPYVIFRQDSHTFQKLPAATQDRETTVPQPQHPAPETPNQQDSVEDAEVHEVTIVVVHILHMHYL